MKRVPGMIIKILLKVILFTLTEGFGNLTT
jgi:hypothetical protein